MQTNEDRDLDMVELGSVTSDTLGEGGPHIESFIGMTVPGLSAD